MRTKWSLSVLLVLVSTMGTLTHSARAQSWNPVLSARGISSVYFLDRFGSPNISFASAGTGIYQTTDGGTTWRLCPNTGGYALRDFTFKDALTGWAIASNSATILKTTDGGSSWTPLIAPSWGTTIRYAAQTQTLFMSYPILGDSWQSTDDGATWTAAPMPGMNGLYFADATSGIWSSHGNFPIYWTTDGGRLWQASNLQFHIFSPTSLGSAHSYYALSEVDDSGFLSLDGGATWKYRGSFPSSLTPDLFYFMASTGCVQFWNGYLWTQTVGDGMFLSTDTGRSWIALCGPSVTYDSRFYARGKTIFAFDDTALFEDPDGTIVPPPASLVVTPDSLRIMVPPCGSAYAFGSIGLVNGCHAELDSLYVTGSNNLRVDQIYLPAQLPEGGLFDLNDRDNGQTGDTGYLHIVWRTNGMTKDTVITVYGTVGGVPETLSLPRLSNLHVRACSRYDTTVLLNSISCDTLEILSISLTDSALLQVVSWTSLPAILPSQSVFPIRLQGTFPHPGTYKDSLRVRVAILPAGTIRDTIIPITIDVGSVARPMVNNLTLRAKNGCEAIDTVIRVENLHCSAGTLDSISVDDSSLVLATDSFPVSLPSNTIVGISILAQPDKSGAAIATITLHFTIDGVEIDTNIFVTVTSPKPSATPLLSASRIAFGPSSLCSAKTAMLIYRNPQCDTLSLTQIRWSYPDSELWFDTASLPIVLAPGESDTILVHYLPAGNWGASGTLDLSFQLEGLSHDTVIGVSGVGTDAPTASLLTDTLSFPTLTTCETGTDSSVFVNTSCDTLLLTNVQDWSPTGFAVISPILPQKIAPGDSITFVFQFAPSANGVFRDSITIEYHSLVDPNITPSVELQLMGSAQTPSGSLTVRGADFRTILLPPCSDWDTSFTIQNPNGCDSLSVDSVSASADGFSITAVPALPARLAPDSAVTIHVHFVPEQDTEYASLHLRGTNLDTVLSLAIIRPRVDSLSFAPLAAPIFATNPCQPVSERFVLSGGGACDTMWVDSLALSDSLTKFSLSGAPVAPFLLQGTDTLRVTYDPNRSGSDSAELIVTVPSETFSLHLPLIGSDTNLPPDARCALSIDGTLCDTIQPGSTATLAIRTLDPIPDSLGLTDVSFQLHFNDNLLTEQQLHPGAGFILGPIQSKSGFLSLDVLHPRGTSIPAGGVLATIDFYVTLGDSTWTPIALSNLRFNPEDSNFERCTLASSTAVDSAFVVVSNSCGAPELRTMLEGKLLTIEGIEPTILRSGARLSVDLSLRAASPVQFKLFTEDGVELSNMVRTLAAGRQTVSFQVNPVPQGAAFLQVSAGGERYVRKIAFE